MSTEEYAIVCNLCGSEDVKLASQAYEEAQAAIPPTPLAQKLKPPSVKKTMGPFDRYWERSLNFFYRYMTPGGCVGQVFAPLFAMFLPLLIWGVIIVFLVAGGDLSSGNNTMNMIAFLLIILFFPAIFVWNVIGKRKLKPQLAEEHREVMEKWNQLHYCQSCEKVSLPGTGELFIDEHEIIQTRYMDVSKLIRPLVIEDKSVDKVEIIQAAELPSEAARSREELTPRGEKIYHLHSESEVCWYCEDQQALESSQAEIAMFGNKREGEKPNAQKSVLWDMAKVVVPRCPECKKHHNRFRNFRIGLVAFLIILMPVLCLGSGYLIPRPFINLILTIIVLGLLWIFGKRFIDNQENKGNNKSINDARDGHPLVLSLIENGWMLKKQ